MNLDFKKGHVSTVVGENKDNQPGRCYLGGSPGMLLLTPVVQQQSVATGMSIKINQVPSHTKSVGIQGKQI